MRENLRNSGTDRKEAEEVFNQNEQCFRLKLDNNLSPARAVENLELAEIIDIQAIQPLMDNFYKLTRIPMGLNDLKGNVLVGAGWQEICTRFHRVHPETCRHCIESNIYLSSGVSPGEFKMYRCKNNMWDIVTPIMVGGRSVGYVFAGQFFFEDEPLDYELFKSQARKYGFDEEEYIAALEKVPRLSKEAVNTAMGFFITFANMLSQLSYSNIKLSQTLIERDSLVSALEENREDLDRAQAVGNIGSWRLDVCDNKLTWSDENHRIFGIPKGMPLTYEIFLSTVYPDDREYVDREWKAGLEGKPYDIEHRIIVDGKIKWVREKAYLEFNKDRSVIGGFGITQDITERKRAEEALKKAHDSLEKLVEERTVQLESAYRSLKENEKSLSEAQKMAHLGNWDWDLLTGKVHWSEELYNIFGRAPQKPSADYEEFLNYVHPNDRDYVHNTIMKSMIGELQGIDYRIIRDSGEERMVHAEREIIFSQNGIPVRARGTIQDITERKKAEEALEKIQETHLKETHHRIKNNLQVISSLLSLEAEKFSDEKVLESFRESQNRVASMALIHEELYRGDNSDALDFAAYLQKLTEELFDSYNLRNSDIILKLDLEKIHLDMDIAIPLGIIVNELVSNSLKHAFPSEKTGEIQINLRRAEASVFKNDIFDEGKECTGKNDFHYTLEVSDNGKGIPEEIEFTNVDSLGLQLVNLLVEQINGCLELKRNHGTKFTIWFRNIET